MLSESVEIFKKEGDDQDNGSNKQHVNEDIQKQF